MAVLYGMYGPNHYGAVWGYDLTAFYTAVSRFAWSLGVAWVVFACVTGYGGKFSKLLKMPTFTCSLIIEHRFFVFLE